MKHDIIHQLIASKTREGFYRLLLFHQKQMKKMCNDVFIKMKYLHYGDEDELVILAKRHPDGREFLITSQSIHKTLVCRRKGMKTTLLDHCLSADQIIYDEIFQRNDKEKAYLYARNGVFYELVLPEIFARIPALCIDDVKRYRNIKEK